MAIGSLEKRACAGKVATDVARDLAVHHRDDRHCDLFRLMSMYSLPWPAVPSYLDGHKKVFAWISENETATFAVPDYLGP